MRSSSADDVERLCAWHAGPAVARARDDESFTEAGLVELSSGHSPGDDHAGNCSEKN